jgi:hypothetical protein
MATLMERGKEFSHWDFEIISLSLEQTNFLCSVLIDPIFFVVHP